MNAEKALQLLDRLESRVSELYSHFHKVFKDDREAAKFFEGLTMDVDSYGSVVQYQLRLVKREPGVFGSVDINESELNGLMDFVDQTINSSKPLTLKEALDVTLKIESTDSKHKYREALVTNNPTLSEFIRSLGVPDEEHSRRLRNFVASKNFH